MAREPIGPTRKMRNRLFIIVVPIVFVLFTVVLGNLVNISIVNGSYYQGLATQQQLRDVSVSANRGVIYDRNMNVIAKNIQVWTVYLSPADIEKEEERQEIALGLSRILSEYTDYETVYQKTLKTNYYEVVVKKIEKDIADEVRAFVSESGLSGIHLIEDTKRFYPNGKFASSVIGFTGDDNQGLYGVEAQYDEELSGTSGRIVALKNAKGSDMPYSYETYYEAEDGNSLVLTLDETIQHYLEQSLEEAVATHQVENRAAGIAMNVNTGEILAMATYPDFDLNDPFTLTDQTLAEQISAITDDDERRSALSAAREAQWKNKAITELYEPGSVFKIVTGSAALEEDKVSLDSSFHCDGFIRVEGLPNPMKCWRTSGHGSQNFVGAMINSCNPAFVTIGQSLGVDTFADYVREFGFMEKTGIDLPGEENSIVYRAEQMGIVELASTSFGQSNKITPIQMITAMAAIVNGGDLVTPYMVSQVLDSDGNVVSTTEPQIKRQVISEETSETMRSVLEQVVSANGGSNAYIPGYRIGGKSGTAQKLDNEDDSAYISSFAAFAPADDPEIAVLIIVDTPRGGQIYGSVVAAPAVSSMLKQTLPYLGVQQEYTEEELANVETGVPNVVKSDVLSAQSTLTGVGLESRVIGEGTTVVSQVPARGTSVPGGSTVILYTDEREAETVEVPDLSGMSPSAANETLTNLGLNIKFDGGSQQAGAIVSSQGTAVGTVVEKGSVITVYCVVNDETG